MLLFGWLWQQDRGSVDACSDAAGHIWLEGGRVLTGAGTHLGITGSGARHPHPAALRRSRSWSGQPHTHMVTL